jgi:hypothetical protein
MKPQIEKHRDLINALKNQRQMDAAKAVERGHLYRFENDTLYLQYPDPYTTSMDIKMLTKHKLMLDTVAKSLGFEVRVANGTESYTGRHWRRKADSPQDDGMITQRQKDELKRQGSQDRKVQRGYRETFRSIRIKD